MTISVSRLLATFLKKELAWRNIEYFDDNWRLRIERMARFVEKGDSVLDLGCGKMWLKYYLGISNTYLPVDYRNRGKGTLICDFNKYQFPHVHADVSFVSGCLEYVVDYRWFISMMAETSKRSVISYCTLEHFPDHQIRLKNAWKNSLRRADILQVFGSVGMLLTAEDMTETKNSIFCFERKR